MADSINDAVLGLALRLSTLRLQESETPPERGDALLQLQIEIRLTELHLAFLRLARAAGIRTIREIEELGV